MQAEVRLWILWHEVHRKHTPLPYLPGRCRLKMLLTTARPHNQRDAEAASGMGKPDNGSKLRTAAQAAMDA